MEYTPSEKHVTYEKVIEKESDMNDIAGLMALVQNNRGMDLPGLLALCRDHGYDRGFGGQGIGLLVILLFFLMFNNGGWGNSRNAAAAVEAVGADNCQRIIGLHDRISAAQTVSTNGFNNLQTWLCESVANLTNSVRNQGDRTYDATRNVGDQVRECCCALNNKLDTILCKVDGLYGHTSLLQERTSNELQAMECRTQAAIVENRRLMELGFERMNCKMDTMAKDHEIARLSRENCELKSTLQGNAIADAAVARTQNFILAHYTPTHTTTTAAA